MSISVDLSEFNRRFEASAKETLAQLGEVFQAQLTSEVRDYPRATKRSYGRGKTGKLADSPRDVVDSKKLVESYDLSVDATSSRVIGKYKYTASHAAIVYTGWVSKNGAQIPPYPWMHKGIKQVDLVQMFKENWDNGGSR